MNTGARGAFIVFEGVDGSGKSTQVKKLVAWLSRGGHDVVATREPHDCEAGRQIREMARSGERVSPEQELAWFQEQRRLHVHDVIEPARTAGKIVVCDRYYFSSAAYQGARGLDPERILRESEAEFPLPDLVLLLDLAPEAGLGRVTTRGEPAEPVFEDLERLQAVAVIYRTFDFPYLVQVDARGQEKAVGARVQQIVSERLGIMV